MVPCTLDLLYYTSVETVATDKVIIAAMPKFIVKVTDNENKHLWRYAVNLIDNLELLQSLYLKEHNLTSIAPVLKSLKQARAISTQFNNLLFTSPVQMMYAILDEKKIYLYTMIRAKLKEMDNISQKRKSLQLQKENLGRIF